MGETIPAASALFSHDGLRDSLTGLAAPPYFYENLAREIVSAKRSQLNLMIARFTLHFQEDLHASVSTIDTYILAFAEALRKNFRSDDFYARLGACEFALLISGREELVLKLAKRLLDDWLTIGKDEVLCVYKSLTYHPGESALDFLNRFDAPIQKEK